MKNILQAVKSCLNGLRVYVDKTTKKLATQEDTAEIKGLVETAQATADNAQTTAERQADWNESDVNSVSYVKNRTHYYVYTRSDVEDIRGWNGIPGGEWGYINSNASNSYIGYSLVHYTDGAAVIMGSMYCPINYEGRDSNGNYAFSAYNSGLKQTFEIIVDASLSRVGFHNTLTSQQIVTQISYACVIKECVPLSDGFIPDTIARKEYVDGKIEDAKPDWDQYDSTAKDYVKNRTHYRDLQPALSGTLDVSDGGFFRIFDATPMSKAFKTWCSVKSMQTEELNRIMVVTAELYRSPTTEDVFTSELYSKNIGNDAVMIDNTNYYYRFKNSMHHIPLYIITDLSTLTEEYAGRFDTVGLYIDVPAERLIKSIDAGVYYYSELSERYIPGTIARTNYVDDKIAKLKSVASTSAYTNQLPLATDTDRTTIYNGDGYIDGYRLSSSGSISAQDGMSTTGFIPATPGQVLRIKGAVPMQGQNNYIIAYNADNTVSKYASMAYDSTGWITPSDGWMQYEDGVIIIPLTSELFGSDFNAVRFCSAQLSDDVIVTVDEEIADPYVQPDWNQNDSTAPDYVKNRTHYADLQYISTWLNYYEVNPLTAGIGIHPLVIAMEGKEDFSFDRFLELEYLRTILSVKITFTVASYGEMDFTDTFFKQIEFIDDYNYKSLLNSVQGYEFYCIRDVTALNEQYREMFTANGAYLRVFEGTGELKASRVSFRCLKFNQLDERYIPDTIARTADVIPLPPTASVGQIIKVSAVDENGKPTAWEATDFEEEWELISEVTIEEEIQTIAQLWEPMKKIRIEVYTPAAAADTNYMPVTIYTADDHSQNFVTGRFYPTALPRKSEYYSEYRVAMEEYDGKIIMRFTESNDLVRNSSRVVGSGTLKEVTSDGNSVYADKFKNVYTTGMHLHSYSLFPVGSTFKFWGVRA